MNIEEIVQRANREYQLLACFPTEFNFLPTKDRNIVTKSLELLEVSEDEIKQNIDVLMGSKQDVKKIGSEVSSIQLRRMIHYLGLESVLNERVHGLSLTQHPGSFVMPSHEKSTDVFSFSPDTRLVFGLDVRGFMFPYTEIGAEFDFHQLAPHLISNRKESIRTNDSKLELDLVLLENSTEIAKFISTMGTMDVELVPLFYRQNPDRGNSNHFYQSWMNSIASERGGVVRETAEARRRTAGWLLNIYLENILDKIPIERKLSVMDVGSNEGFQLAQYQRVIFGKNKNVELYGIEPNTRAAEKSRKNTKGYATIYQKEVKELVGNVEPIDFMSAIGVTTFDVMPYNEVFESVLAMHDMLSDGGVLIISGYSPVTFNSEEFNRLGFTVLGKSVPQLLFMNPTDRNYFPHEFYVLAKTHEPNREFFHSKNYLTAKNSIQ